MDENVSKYLPTQQISNSLNNFHVLFSDSVSNFVRHHPGRIVDFNQSVLLTKTQ